MTKKLEDLFKGFSASTYEEQIAHITKVRSARHMERPVAAVKRVKREVKKRNTDMTKARGLALSLSPEQRAALIAKLKKENP